MSFGARSLALEHLRSNPAEAAAVLERRAPGSVAEILADAPPETSAGVLALLSPLEGAACLKRMPGPTRKQVLQACPAPASAALLRVLPEASRKSILEDLSVRTRQRIDQALRFPPGSAGAMADPRACALYADLTVEQAIDRLRDERNPVASTLFVISRERRVRGTLTPGQLLVAPCEWTVGSLQLAKARIVSQSVSVSALVSEEQTRGVPVAVLNPSGRLVGVLSEQILRAVARPKAARHAAQLTGALCELYWCGMGQLASEALSIVRVAPELSGVSRGQTAH